MTGGAYIPKDSSAITVEKDRALDDSLHSERARRRARRRAARRRDFDTTVPSPCISVCQLDDVTGYCLGCHRNVEEIRDWPILTAEEKKAILTNIAARKAAGGSGA